MFTAGALDTTFGVGGIVTTNLNYASQNSIAVQGGWQDCHRRCFERPNNLPLPPEFGWKHGRYVR
jgi:hypothetical protein